MRSLIARAAGSRTPSASTGNGVAGANSRINGRGGSGLTCGASLTASRMRSAPEASGMGQGAPRSLGGEFAEQDVVEVGTGVRRQHDADATAFSKPALCRNPGGTFASPGCVV